MEPKDLFDYFNEEDYTRINHRDDDYLVPTDDICDEDLDGFYELDINTVEDNYEN